MRDHLLKQFEHWLQRIEGEWAGMSHASLRVEMELETGLHDYAVVVMTTGIVGFREDQTPIIEPSLIHPAMQRLFQNSKALQQFVKDTLTEVYGIRGGWAAKRGEELAEKGMAAALQSCISTRWQHRVQSKPVANGVARRPAHMDSRRVAQGRAQKRSRRSRFLCLLRSVALDPSLLFRADQESVCSAGGAYDADWARMDICDAILRV